MSSLEEKRAYSRGYVAGRRCAWHLHRPPMPPDEIVRPLYQAARKLRDEADAFCAQYEENDPGLKGICDGIDAVDEAFTALGEWLTQLPYEESVNG